MTGLTEAFVQIYPTKIKYEKVFLINLDFMI